MNVSLTLCASSSDDCDALPTDGNLICRFSSGPMSSVFTAGSSFLFTLKYTRSACRGMSVKKSFIIGLIVGGIPQTLKPKPKSSLRETLHVRMWPKICSDCIKKQWKCFNQRKWRIEWTPFYFHKNYIFVREYVLLSTLCSSFCST